MKSEADNFSQEMQNVVRAIKKLSAEDKQALAIWLTEHNSGLDKIASAEESPNTSGVPGSNDGNTDSEPTSDAQQRQ